MGTPCKFEGCSNIARGLGYCAGHYRQLRHGKELHTLAVRTPNQGQRCTGPECTKNAYSKGLCGSHKCQLDRGVPLTPLGAERSGPKPKYEGVACAFEGCNRNATAVGLCGGHRAQRLKGWELRPLGWRPPRPVVACSEDGCADPASRKGLCQPHYRQMLRLGRTVPRRRSDGRYISPDGYAYVKRPESPEATYNGGWGLEHRVVMADILGRALLPKENVHHRNGIRDDNRLDNLELWSKSQPPGQRVADKLKWAHELIDLYADVPAIAVAVD